ncbi:MAG: hypothetical protein Q6367_003065, partial [Candidatus Freyarchaeota archaeon]
LGISSGSMRGIVGYKKSAIVLGALLSLVALKCMLTQTDVKSEIQKIEREISRIEKWKLPKEYVEKLREKYKHQQKKKKDKRVPLFEIKKIPDSDKTVEIIYKNKSKELEDKEAELTKKGIEAKLEPTCIYLRGKVVSAEWVLEWFEREEGDGNG